MKIAEVGVSQVLTTSYSFILLYVISNTAQNYVSRTVKYRYIIPKGTKTGCERTPWGERAYLGMKEHTLV
jgi:hypothetical protein